MASGPTVQNYYASLESRLGYRLFLGDTRHFGYYEKPDSLPLPLGPALRTMEGQLLKALQCPKGSRVLDAGCGVGHVALYMARAANFKVEAIDIIPRHITLAKQNVERAHMVDSVHARVGDYHHLEDFDTASFDGIYTMETLVHSPKPLEVLKEFLRLLKPGGRIALNEYDHVDLEKAPKYLVDAMNKVNKYSAMPGNASFDQGVLKELLEEVGFEDVQLRDLSEHVVPMLWLFYIFAIIPYMLFKSLGIECHFVNTMAGAECYRGRHLWRYIQVTGRKKA